MNYILYYKFMDKLIFEKTYYNTRNHEDKTFQPFDTKNYSVYQIGDTYYLYGGTIPQHKQAFTFEFTFVENGNALIYTNNTPCSVKKGDIFISLKDELHKIVANDTFRFSYFAIDVKPKSRFFKLSQHLFKQFSNPNLKSIYQPRLFYLISNILTENLHPDKFSKQLIDDNITHLLINLYRGQIPTFSNVNNDELYIYEIIKDIDINFLLYNTIGTLANKYGYTAESFALVFKKATNQSIKTYLMKIRFDHAKELLKSGKKISEVAEILNYSSPYNFSRAYKSFFGYSPNLEKTKNQL